MFPVAASTIFAGSTAASVALGLQKPINLKCDDLTTPFGSDTPQPQLSWHVHDDRFGAKQTAHTITMLTAGGKLDLQLCRGIDALDTDASFHTIYLHPNFDPRLGSLDLSYASRYGNIHSS